MVWHAGMHAQLGQASSALGSHALTRPLSRCVQVASARPKRFTALDDEFDRDGLKVGRASWGGPCSSSSLLLRVLSLLLRTTATVQHAYMYVCFGLHPSIAISGLRAAVMPSLSMALGGHAPFAHQREKECVPPP